MVRRWRVDPNPHTGVVDREAMREAFTDAEALLAVAGGTLSVVLDRQRDDFLPHAAHTVTAFFEWKDRTDGQQAPRPEETVEPSVAEDPNFPMEEPVDYDEETVGEIVVDENGEPVEDLSSIPAGKRG